MCWPSRGLNYWDFKVRWGEPRSLMVFAGCEKILLCSPSCRKKNLALQSILPSHRTKISNIVFFLKKSLLSGPVHLAVSPHKDKISLKYIDHLPNITPAESGEESPLGKSPSTKVSGRVIFLPCVAYLNGEAHHVPPYAPPLEITTGGVGGRSEPTHVWSSSRRFATPFITGGILVVCTVSRTF